MALSLLDHPTKAASPKRPEANIAPVYAGVLKMLAEDWIAVRDNPRQRDTEQRAKRAKHLRSIHPTHCRVNAARLPTGEMYKLDGHTRAFLWAKGELEAPQTIFADIWECQSIGDIKSLYETYDSTAAVETTTDKVFGAVREGKLEFQSEILKSQRFTSGMRSACDLLFGSNHTRDLSPYSMIEYWTPELLLLDECEPTRRRFHAGVLAAALLTFRRYGPEARRFWKNYAAGAGSKIDGERDPVQALEERMEKMRGDRQITGRGNVINIIRICLSAFDAYWHDRVYSADSSGIKAWRDVTLDKFLTATAKTRRTW